MSAEEQSLEHKRALSSLSKNLGSNTPIQPEPFPKMERSRRVSSNLQMTPQNLIGQTWDVYHLDKLLKAANSSDNLHSQSSIVESQIQSYGANQNKNSCLYGYTNIFPLIGTERSNHGSLIEHKSQQLKITSPINQEYFEPSLGKPVVGPRANLEKMLSLKQEINKYHEDKASKGRQIRLKHLLANHYRHGVVGYENPQSVNKEYSGNFVQQPTLCPQKRSAAQRNYDHYIKSYIFNPQKDNAQYPRQTYELSPVMKRKGRASSVQQIDHECQAKPAKKIIHQGQRNFDILSNRQLD